MGRFAVELDASDILAGPPLGVATIPLLAAEDEGGHWEVGPPPAAGVAEPPVGAGDDLVRLTDCDSTEPGPWLPVLSEGLRGRPPDEDKRCRLVELSGSAVELSDLSLPTAGVMFPMAAAKLLMTEDATLDLREERPAWIGIKYRKKHDDASTAASWRWRANVALTSKLGHDSRSP